MAQVTALAIYLFTLSSGHMQDQPCCQTFFNPTPVPLLDSVMDNCAPLAKTIMVPVLTLRGASEVHVMAQQGMITLTYTDHLSCHTYAPTGFNKIICLPKLKYFPQLFLHKKLICSVKSDMNYCSTEKIVLANITSM